MDQSGDAGLICGVGVANGGGRGGGGGRVLP